MQPCPVQPWTNCISSISKRNFVLRGQPEVRKKISPAKMDRKERRKELSTGIHSCRLTLVSENCELPCHPEHGTANTEGKCVCVSMKWTGDDCSIEVLENRNLIPTNIKALAYSMFGFNMLLIVICGWWLYWKRESAQVKFSQPFFLNLVLFGCSVSSSTIIAMGQECPADNPVHACMVSSSLGRMLYRLPGAGSCNLV